MGMMLHRHSGVVDKTAPELVIKENKINKPEKEEPVQKDRLFNDPVKHGRKRNN